MSLLPFYKKNISCTISATRSQPLNVRGCVSSPSAMSWVSASAASQPALVWNKVQSLASKLYLPRTGATFLFPSHFRFSSFEDLYGVHFPDFKKIDPAKPSLNMSWTWMAFISFSMCVLVSLRIAEDSVDLWFHRQNPRKKIQRWNVTWIW